MKSLLNRWSLPPLGLIAAGLFMAVVMNEQYKANSQQAEPVKWISNDLADPNGLAILTLEKSESLRQTLSWTNSNTIFLEARQPWTAPVIEPEPIEIQDPIPVAIAAMEAPVTEDIPLPNLELLGVLAEDTTRRALLSNLEDQSEVWVSVGQVILDGWIVTEIQPKQVKLTREDKEIIAKFRE